LRDVPNVFLELSGSGVDRGMLDDALLAVGPRRLLWGADITLCTGLAKLWALEVIGLSADDLADIRWRNASRIFPASAFGALSTGPEESSGRRQRENPSDAPTRASSPPSPTQASHP
jgi:hypothetical protein